MAIKINYNIYPTRYRLPGDKTPSRKGLAPVIGPVRRGIVHALTYHELPPGIDALIKRLPKESKFEGLSGPQKTYLSFTVYSLKQMVAAGTISAETAWTLFYDEWVTLGRVGEANYAERRSDIVRKVGAFIGGPSTALLRLEFQARAGEAGLAQFERYGEWAQKLAFRDKDHLTEAQKDEYRKALWLEMRLIEDRVGLTGMNEDLNQFKLDDRHGEYGYLWFRGSIDLYRQGLYGIPPAIDSIIKAEVGHWLSDSYRIHELHPRERNHPTAIVELPDRMNIAGFTARVNEGFRSGVKDELLPPEIRAFREGGFYMQTGLPADREAAYPTFPEYYDSGYAKFLEREGDENDAVYAHRVAEGIDMEMRHKLVELVRQRVIKPDEAYSVYRRAGIYASMVFLECGGTEAERMKIVTDKLENFDVAEINAYFAQAKDKLMGLWRKIATEEPWPAYRGMASRSLLRFGGAVDQADAKRLAAYRLAGDIGNLAEYSKDIFGDDKVRLQEMAGELDNMGEVGARVKRETIDYLTKVLTDDNLADAGAAAKALIVLKRLDRGAVECEELWAYALIYNIIKIEAANEGGNKEIVWEELYALGPAARKALEATLKYSVSLGSQAAEGLDKINDQLSIPVLEEAFESSNLLRIKRAAGEALIHIRGITPDSADYLRLHIYQLIRDENLDEITALGGLDLLASIEADITTGNTIYRKKIGRLLARAKG